MDPWWVPLANQLVLFVLQFLAALGLALLHLAGRKVADYLRLHATKAQRDLLACLAAEAFSFAETVYRDSDGPAKLEQAMGYLSQRLRQHGVTVTPDEMRAAVEQAWLQDRRNHGPGTLKQQRPETVPAGDLPGGSGNGSPLPPGNGGSVNPVPGWAIAYDPPGGQAGPPGLKLTNSVNKGGQGLA
ncbi:phage holin, LLH family [Kyrpidia sp.]|uniref:phage holin, LLH family n=1 Tax=Kyrpidia sp. TaxID=2073077 RepID=UPI00181C1415|nr:phage holin, LLH family [Kyrpidia sp.]MCL6574903.1 phage holin family protein [Kyrpidia sp.]HHY68562.1 hypothetical protein [Alicyclobacillus sp.]